MEGAGTKQEDGTASTMVKDQKEGVVEGKAASKHDPLAKMPEISTQNLSQNLERLKPFLEACVKLGEVLIPLAQKYSAIAFKFYEDYLEQYYSPDLVELTLGCVLLFFWRQLCSHNSMLHRNPSLW